MSKLLKIVTANACIVLIYAGGFWVTAWLGTPLDDLFKLVPTAAASALGNIITLSFALNTYLKGCPRFNFRHPSKENWSITTVLLVDCRGADGIVLEGIEADFLGHSFFRPETCQESIDVQGFQIGVDKAVNIHVGFDVLEANKTNISSRKKLSVVCRYVRDGDASIRAKTLVLKNPFYC